MKDPGEPEVAHDNVVITVFSVHEAIARLDVAMYEPLIVGRRERVADLRAEIHGLRGRQHAASGSCVGPEVLAHILHDQECHIITRHPYVCDPNHMPVPDLGNVGSLPNHQRGRLPDHSRPEDLDRGAQGGSEDVLGKVYIPHSSMAQVTKDPIALCQDLSRLQTRRAELLAEFTGEGTIERILGAGIFATFP